MARPGITYQDVALAAEYLVTQQKTPTIETIRAHLGTGSHSTIAAHYRAWKTKQTAKSPFIENHLPDSLLTALNALWNDVTEEANVKIQAIQQETESVRQEVERRLEESTSKCNQLSQRLVQMDCTKDTLQREKFALEQSLVEMQQTILQITTAQEGLSRQIVDKDDRIAELKEINEVAQKNLEHYRESAREQRLIDQQKYEAQLDQRQLQIKKLEQQKTILDNEKLALTAEINAKTNENATIHNEMKHLQVWIEDLKNCLARKEDELKTNMMAMNKLRTDSQLLKTEIHRFSVEQIALVEYKINSERTISQLQNDINNLTIENKSLLAQKYQTIAEKERLLGQIEELRAHN